MSDNRGESNETDGQKPRGSDEKEVRPSEEDGRQMEHVPSDRSSRIFCGRTDHKETGRVFWKDAGNRIVASNARVRMV